MDTDGTNSPEKRKWKLQPHGSGTPLSVFDIPDPKEESVPPTQAVSPRVYNGIAIAVTAVWVVSFLADIFVEEYSPPAAIHAAFLLIAGTIFGFQIINGSKKE